MRAAGAFTLAALGALVFGGCESIAGIEDRVYEEPFPGSPECAAYCDDVMAACSGDQQLYVDRASCIGTCEQLPRGTDAGATLECFAKQANIALKTEPEVHCKSAGPFGGGLCGSACDSYCALMEKVCPDEFAFAPGCVDKCAGLEDDGFAPLAALDTGDTLGCRIHKLTLATRQPELYCSDVGIVPSVDSVCVNPFDQPPTCDSYCELVTAACSGAHAVYESAAQCRQVCAALPVGITGHTTENTVGCRKYHSYSSMSDPTTHCPHTGPGGDGHCGKDDKTTGDTGNCESYCLLLAEACPNELTQLGGAAGCKADCKALPGAAADSNYSVSPPPTGDTLQCRLYQLTLTLAGSPQCAAAVGGAPCS